MGILIAAADPALAKRIDRSLTGLEDVRIETVAGPFELLRSLLSEDPALVLLDLDLPGQAAGLPHPTATETFDALALLAAFRDRAPLCPLLVLTGEASPQLRAQCLLGGADDCLSKPLSMVELRARSLALLRRARAAFPNPARMALRFGCLELDRLRREASVAGELVRLTGREFLLLEQLALAGGRVLSRAALVRSAGNGGASQPVSEANSLDVHMAALRRKLRDRDAAPLIETVRGIGFQLTLPEQMPALTRASSCPGSVLAAGCAA